MNAKSEEMALRWSRSRRRRFWLDRATVLAFFVTLAALVVNILSSFIDWLKWAQVPTRVAIYVCFLVTMIRVVERFRLRMAWKRRSALERPAEPEWPTWSKRSVRRAGEAVRLGTEFREGDPTLEQIVAFHHEYANWVKGILECLDFRNAVDDPDVLATSARAKSLDTIREKLIRERYEGSATQLDTIRDLAGVRVIGDMRLVEQSILAKLIRENFGADAVRVVDRRGNDSHGYRALHLELSQHSWKCEIQIRTRLQQAWADSFESLADVCGRQVRYGGEPTGEGELLVKRKGWIEGFQRISSTIEMVEEADDQSRDLEFQLVGGFVRGLGKWRLWIDWHAYARAVKRVRWLVTVRWQRRQIRSISDKIEDGLRNWGSPKASE